MVSQQELLDFFSNSADTYRFISRMMFKELNDEAIAELAKADYPTDTGNDCLDEGYRLLRRYFRFSGVDRRSQLACEYARIFLAAGVYTKEKRTAIPYESVFTSEEHIMMQEARDDVVKRYRADGFKVNPDLHEPEDHLSFEFEYLANLSDRALEEAKEKDQAALRNTVERQLDFIETHLLNWVPQLREVASSFAKLAFYLGMLYVAQGSLEQARDMLQEILAQIDGVNEADESGSSAA